MNFELEICVDNVDSAINAQIAGASRVELCGNLIAGGTTPSPGTIISTRYNLNIGLHVLIRPRDGDFLYTDLEYDIMRRDIDFCGENGIDGIVLGILRPEGEIDVERTANLIEFAHPMSVTFHRAYDMCLNPVQALKDVIETGSQRLLTSGHKDKAYKGIELINQLVMQAGNRIIIMPGSGVNESNIASLAKGTGAKEFHLTGRKIIESEMIFRRDGITMGNTHGINEFTRMVADPDLIRNIIDILKSL